MGPSPRSALPSGLCRRAVAPGTDGYQRGNEHRPVSGDGTVVKEWEAVEIQPRDGRLTRLAEISLGDTAPGGYQFVVRVRDEVAGKVIETREPIEIVAAAD